MAFKRATSVKSDRLVARVLDVNDVNLKEIEGHESEKVNMAKYEKRAKGTP